MHAVGLSAFGAANDLDDVLVRQASKRFHLALELQHTVRLGHLHHHPLEESSADLEWCREYDANLPWEFTFAQLSNRRHEYWLNNLRDPIST